MPEPDDAAERRLMTSIRERWGDLILEVCSRSSVPPAFLGSLIALESGGDPDKSRFEQSVYDRLHEKYPDKDKKWCQENACSYGLCQVLGEHIPDPPEALEEPQFNLEVTLRLLAQAAESYGLDLRKDFIEMFRVHNTGRPDGETFDPEYVPKGLKRMALWQELAAS